MGKFWMKVWIWVKVVVFACFALYAAIFAYNNHASPSDFWVWPGKPVQTNSLNLAFFAFVAGVLASLLIRTTFKTIRQIRDVQDRNRHEKMQRDLEDVKAKAGMLRTKTSDEKTDKT
jgi:lysylphosphatidylglycerol synthetase-like protein (DUF2156 family)